MVGNIGGLDYSLSIPHVLVSIVQLKVEVLLVVHVKSPEHAIAHTF